MRLALADDPAVRTQAHVVSVRRSDAYMLLPHWSKDVLVRVPRIAPHSDRAPLPACGMVYSVDAVLGQDPVAAEGFGLCNWREVPVECSTPVVPPQGVPGPGEELPMHSAPGLHRLIQSAVDKKLNKKDVEALAYLLRRAHHEGAKQRSQP